MAGRFIDVVSDSTGETAEKVVRAALLQFPQAGAVIRLHTRVRTKEIARVILERSSKEGALFVFTVVSPELREFIHSSTSELRVDAVDVIRSCTLPDRDLVLPRLGVREDQESIAVLACGGEEAVATLARRIEGQLARSPALQSGRLAWMIRSLALESGRDDTLDPAARAGRLAAEIETALDDIEPCRSAA